MKKSLIIIILVVLLGIVLIFGWLYLQNKTTKEEDTIFYNRLKCLSECPHFLDKKVNVTFGNYDCLEECGKKYPLSEKYEKSSSGTIASSEELSLCMREGIRKYDKYKECLKEIFPKLEEKYPHIKNG